MHKVLVYYTVINISNSIVIPIMMKIMSAKEKLKI